jgi:hypothetical protein
MWSFFNKKRLEIKIPKRHTEEICALYDVFKKQPTMLNMHRLWKRVFDIIGEVDFNEDVRELNLVYRFNWYVVSR